MYVYVGLDPWSITGPLDLRPNISTLNILQILWVTSPMFATHWLFVTSYISATSLWTLTTWQGKRLKLALVCWYYGNNVHMPLLALGHTRLISCFSLPLAYRFLETDQNTHRFKIGNNSTNKVASESHAKPCNQDHVAKAGGICEIIPPRKAKQIGTQRTQANDFFNDMSFGITFIKYVQLWICVPTFVYKLSSSWCRPDHFGSHKMFSCSIKFFCISNCAFRIVNEHTLCWSFGL